MRLRITLARGVGMVAEGVYEIDASYLQDWFESMYFLTNDRLTIEIVSK